MTEIKELNHVNGRVWQVGDKHFFAPDEGWWPGIEKKIMHTFDHEKLIKEALAKYPDTDYFLANDDRTAFEPDENHEEWSAEELIK